MKHILNRRSPWLSLGAVFIIAFMLLPIAVFALGASPSAGGELMSLASIGFLGAPMMLRDAADGDAPDAGGGVSVTEALAKIEDRSLTITERLTIAAKALGGVDPTNQLAKVKDDLATARAEAAQSATSLSESQATITAMQAELDARNADVTTLEARVAELEAANAKLEANEQDLSKRAEALSKEKLGALGVPSNALPITDPKAGELDDNTEAEAKIRELTGAKRVEAALHYKAKGTLPAWMN